MHSNRRQLISATIIALAYAAVPKILKAETTAPLGKLSPAQMREDLTYLKTQWAPRDRSFSDPQRDLFNRMIEQASARAETSLVSDFALDIMQAVAIPRNGHTAAMVGRLLGDLPIRMWWFAEGLFVLSTHPSCAELLGARVTRLGTLSPEAALEKVTPYISGTDQRIRYLSATYLGYPAVLHRIGAIDDIENVPITLILRDGTTRNLKLETAIAADPNDTHAPVLNGWSALIPDDQNLAGRWPHVLDSIEKRSPTYEKPTDFSMKWLGDDAAVLYIRSNRILSQGQDRLDDKLLLGALQNQLVARGARSVIVDLRLNNGGNFFNTILFAQALPKLVPEDGHVFVLISRATFSAALVTVAILKGAGQDKVTLIGEPMGDKGRFWAEPELMTLPNSKIGVWCSTKLEDYERGCEDPGQCYWANVAFGPKNISLQPDIRIDVAFSDYATGQDPVLARALALAKAR